VDLNQVTVQSVNIPESIAFYRALGLTLIVESPHYARFECPNGNATFSVHLVDRILPSNTVVYFEVGDVEQTVSQLEAAGFQFKRQPTLERWLWQEARLEDPSGNEICIYTAGDNRKYPPWRIA
jgi:catechol 2,3-dioxygenase-like lactoylglutathione lyase family enzyme